jgi:hypothetical protein
MKTQLESAIKDLVALGIDLDKSFYAISSNYFGASFQGKYNNEVVDKLYKKGLFDISVDGNGYIVMSRKRGDVLVTVVFN